MCGVRVHWDQSCSIDFPRGPRQVSLSFPFSMGSFLTMLPSLFKDDTASTFGTFTLSKVNSLTSYSGVNIHTYNRKLPHHLPFSPRGIDGGFSLSHTISPSLWFTQVLIHKPFKCPSTLELFSLIHHSFHHQTNLSQTFHWVISTYKSFQKCL